MEYAVVAVPAAPVRRKARHSSEMTNQLLFGETVRIIKTKGDLWVKISSLHDGYEGWLTNTLLEAIDENDANTMTSFTASDLLSVISIGERKLNIPAGSTLPFFAQGKGQIGASSYEYNGQYLKRNEQEPSAELLKKLTHLWLNAPYMWGGRTPLGVDCSGFVQVIFKQIGIDLPRDAWQQAQQGQTIKKFSEVQAGDLAFFNNKEDIVHTGILLGEGKMIHASGRVKIDDIDKKGVVDKETGKRILKLRAVKRMW
jgi:cell wall-associated NlpC family hydrolase